MSNTDLVRRMFALVDAKADIEEYLSYFTPDAVYKAGNFDPAIGHEGIKVFAGPMVEMFSAVKHEVKGIWEASGGIVIAELVITYTRKKDGKPVDIPCLDVIQLQNGKVKSLQAYLDASPAFA